MDNKCAYQWYVEDKEVDILYPNEWMHKYPYNYIGWYMFPITENDYNEKRNKCTVLPYNHNVTRHADPFEKIDPRFCKKLS